MKLHHDFETYCDLDVRRVGAHKYAMHKSCEVLILSWGTSTEDLETWLPFKHKRMPRQLVEYLRDPEVLLYANNAQFEYCIWNYVLRRHHDLPDLPPERFRCTAAMAAAAGLPRSLDKLGAALNLPIQKDKDGQRLIKKFSAPRKPTKANPATRIMPEDDWPDFEKYIDYNRTDVLTEVEAAECMPELTRAEQRFYALDMRMNDRGLPLDMEAVTKAMPILTKLEKRVQDRVTELTGGIRPTQRDKMLEMFNGLGLEVENLQAKTIKDVLATKKDMSPKLIELLRLRVEGGKASTKKLKKMLELVCDDGRVRGGFLFYGAGTGRWSGKGIQPQNFTRGEYKPHQLENLFDLLKTAEAEDIELLYEWPIDAIAQGMRGFIAPPPGKKFVVSDFAAIEARKLAWLADEKPMLEVYRRNGDVYVRMASMLYNVPEAELLAGHKAGDKDCSGKRKFGKDIVLGCGYQMGGPGFHRNCLMRGIIIEEDFARRAVNVYREGHPAIVKYWADAERCAIAAVENRVLEREAIELRGTKFYIEVGEACEWLCIRLPSRYHVLRYVNPKVEMAERFNKRVKKLTYRSEYKGKWIREGTYGGKIVENITQAAARDVMAEAMLRVEKHGYETVGTVHDELVEEVDADFGSAHELETLMSIRPKWCPDSPISAEGWEGFRYRK